MDTTRTLADLDQSMIKLGKNEHSMIDRIGSQSVKDKSKKAIKRKEILYGTRVFQGI